VAPERTSALFPTDPEHLEKLPQLFPFHYDIRPQDPSASEAGVGRIRVAAKHTHGGGQVTSFLSALCSRCHVDHREGEGNETRVSWESSIDPAGTREPWMLSE
jgi:hypothetical protein